MVNVFWMIFDEIQYTESFEFDVDKFFNNF